MSRWNDISKCIETLPRRLHGFTASLRDVLRRFAGLQVGNVAGAVGKDVLRRDSYDRLRTFETFERRVVQNHTCLPLTRTADGVPPSR